MTNVLWFCVYAWMYLKLRNKYKTFTNVCLIFTKSCIQILLLNNKNVFCHFFTYYQWKSRLLNIFEEIKKDFCVFFQKKLFFIFEKLLVSRTWNFGNKFGQLNKWYRPCRLYWISWKVHFLFCEKKPGLKSSLLWSGYLNILISYSKSWYQYQNKNTLFTSTLEPC